MFKHTIFLFLLLFSTLSLSRVAYIPFFDGTDRNNPIEDSIIVVDLNTGDFLKKIHVGNGVGAVFINDFGDKLYASAEDENKIVLIDTTTLTVSHEWTSLPVKPQQIILNKAEDILYFSEYNNDNIYQIDLNNNQVSIALTLPGFERFWYSENLDYIVLKTYDSIQGTYQIHTYDLNQISYLYQRTFSDNYTIFVSNDGAKYYLPVFSPARLYSLNLNNTDTNWYFFYEYFPSSMGLFMDHFSYVREASNNSLFVVGHHGTYDVNINTGIGTKISDLDNSFGSFDMIEENSFLISTRPTLPICGVPPPGVDCYNYYPLQLFVQNHLNETETLIFQRDRAGSLARGRYIGDLLYSPPVIPAVGNLGIFIFALSVLSLGVFRYRQYKQ